MASPIKIIKFSDSQKPQVFSPPSQDGAKIASESDSAKIVETAGNMGFSLMSDIPPMGELGGTAGVDDSPKSSKTKSPKPAKKKSPKSHAPAKPLVTPTGGPEGYKVDCATMTPGQLHAAYPSEYQSWKDGKSRCKQKGWPWAVDWKPFKGFLLSMGPKPDPTYTLDRIVNALGEYGPGLCQWADKTTQNNNKSDNIKIVVPLTGVVLSAQKLAKHHGVTTKTLYKWKANYYSDLEMVAGKTSKLLRDLSLALDELPAAQLQKGKKAPVRKLQIPKYTPPTFEDELEQTDEEYEHYLVTGEMKGTKRHAQYRAEYDALVAWTNAYNAGLPVSPQPPQGRYWARRLPTNVAKQIEPSPPPLPTAPEYADEDDEFDPADCDDPEYVDDEGDDEGGNSEDPKPKSWPKVTAWFGHKIKEEK